MRSGGSSPLGLPLSGRFTARQVDWIVVLVAAGLTLPSVVRGAGHGRLVAAMCALPLATLPLLFRRSYPGVVVAVLVAVLFATADTARIAPGGAGVLFALFAAARYGSHRVRVTTGALTAAASVSTYALLIGTGRVRVVPHLGVVAFGAGVAWVLGEAARTREAYLAELEERALRLEHERDEHARRATEEERTRIARELHDVVTHHVSAIAVQAAAARSTSQSRPERALEVLGVIERTARSTLSELRRHLGVLRASDPAPLAPHPPRPTIAELDELVAQTRAAGVTVDTTVTGTPLALDAALDLSAYRVLQEALTNVIKHAPGAHATVVVQYGQGRVRIAVTDDGPGWTAGWPDGHGLTGMRERVALVGGTLEASSMVGGGFRVCAELPLGGGRRPSADPVLACAENATAAPLLRT